MLRKKKAAHANVNKIILISTKNKTSLSTDAGIKAKFSKNVAL